MVSRSSGRLRLIMMLSMFSQVNVHLIKPASEATDSAPAPFVGGLVDERMHGIVEVLRTVDSLDDVLIVD